MQGYVGSAAGVSLITVHDYNEIHFQKIKRFDYLRAGDVCHGMDKKRHFRMVRTWVLQRNTVYHTTSNNNNNNTILWVSQQLYTIIINNKLNNYNIVRCRSMYKYFINIIITNDMRHAKYYIFYLSGRTVY